MKISTSDYSKTVDYDKFYTNVDTANDCLSLLDLSRYDLVIEPSAGAGAFSNNIDHPNLVSIDISPESDCVQQGDWFEYQIPEEYKNVLVVGNPPFGLRNKLSKAFIQHACSFPNVDTVAFVLPSVYHKHTLQKSIPLDYRIKTIKDLKENSFNIQGENYSIPAIFMIMDKSNGEDLRFNPDLYKETDHWTYGTERDYTFFVMGAAPKTLKDIPEPNNRGYYIKLKEGVGIIEVIEKFKSIEWQGYSSANGGVSWFTKSEMAKKYQESLDF